MSITVVLLFVLVGFCAGFVDSIAGGGGLISMPALLAAGMPPHLALGTNKLQSAMGTTFATANYARRGLITREGLALGVGITGPAAFFGAFAVTRLPGDLLVRVIPWLLGAIFVYVLVSPRIGDERRHARLAPAAFHGLFGLVLGFYDGFFGPGTGTFWTMGYVMLMGFTLPHATGHTKVMNLTSNVASLAWFAWHGDVAWLAGLLMGAANIAGALTGSTLAIRRGAGFIRVVFLLVVGATIARLVWRSFQ
ncbi:MAG: TSUP family transporter [Opitutaceae bacterium]|nr:TSUP family transporter [Opitutaceae bacterium]